MINLNKENVTTALRAISGLQTGSEMTPGVIKEAENALLSWENSNPTPYAHHLLEILTSPSSPTAPEIQVPRLAAVLTMKAMVGRKWKDRGRLSKKTKLILLDSDTKGQIRNVLLSVLTTGGAAGDYILDRNLSISLIRDKTLMTTIGSILSKIGSSDLPLEFKELVPNLIHYSIGSYAPIDHSVDVETRFNATNALEFILADLCFKRLLIYKKYVISISSDYLSDLVNKGLCYSMELLTSPNVKADFLPVVLEYATIMTKILRHLILSSLPSLVDGAQKVNNNRGQNLDNGSANNKNQQFIQNTAKAIDNVFEMLLKYIPLSCNFLKERTSSHPFEHSNDTINDNIKELLEEFYTLVVTTQKAHPVAFSRFLSPFLNLFSKDLEQMVSNKETEPLFAIPQMTFLGNVISCPHYRPDQESNESMETYRNEVQNNGKRAITSHGDVSIDTVCVNNSVKHVWTIFLTIERIHMLVDASLFFMMIKDSQLTDWYDDAESFYIERKNAVADDDVIASAQQLYLSLLESKCGSVVVEKLSSFINRLDEQIEAAHYESGLKAKDSNYSVVLFWDAIYTCIGLSLIALKQIIAFDINNWLSSRLSHVFKALMVEQSQHQPNLPILRHRIIWLVECAFAHLGDQCHLAVGMLSNVLIHRSNQNDSAVKLAAVQALSTIAYDPPENFISFLNQPDNLIESLYILTNELEEVDNKAEPLSLVQLLLTTFMISNEYIDDDKMITSIVRPLEQIWNSSVDQYLMLRSSVLSILRSVAAFGKNHAINLQPVTLPLLDHALDPNNHEHTFLVADSLDLWLSMLRFSTVYDSNWCIIFHRTKQLLQQDLEHLKKLMLITEGYILLGGASFWNNHSSSLELIMKLIIGNISARGAMYANLVLEALLKTVPVEGTSMLLNSGVVATMLRSIAETYNDEDHCEPYEVINMYLTIISRVLLATPNNMRIVAAYADECNNFGFCQVVDLYFQQFNNLYDPPRQKLWTMLLLSLLLPPNLDFICSTNLLTTFNFNRILQCSLNVLQEKATLTPYSVGYDSEEETLTLHVGNHEFLNNALSAKDPCYATDFRAFYLDAMRTFQNTVDAAHFQNLLQSVDKQLLSNLDLAVTVK